MFEVTAGDVHCLVCGDSVDGLALPLQSGARLERRDDSVPIEVGDREVTEPLRRRE